MKQLEVGDRLYNARRAVWETSTKLKFDIVESVTENRAKLSRGEEINRKHSIFKDEHVVYYVEGERGDFWCITTEEVLLEAKEKKEREFISEWLKYHTFTAEERKEIYLKYRKVNQPKDLQ